VEPRSVTINCGLCIIAEFDAAKRSSYVQCTGERPAFHCQHLAALSPNALCNQQQTTYNGDENEGMNEQRNDCTSLKVETERQREVDTCIELKNGRRTQQQDEDNNDQNDWNVGIGERRHDVIADAVAVPHPEIPAAKLRPRTCWPLLRHFPLFYDPNRRRFTGGCGDVSTDGLGAPPPPCHADSRYCAASRGLSAPRISPSVRAVLRGWSGSTDQRDNRLKNETS
jgi:hypothetical protein